MRASDYAMIFSPITSAAGTAAKQWRPALREWGWIGIGLCALYLPTLFDLFTGIWSEDEQMHGPVVLGISCWLLYRNWPRMLSETSAEDTTPWGWPIIFGGIVCYFVGRVLNIPTFEVGSAVVMVLGVLLVTRGARAAKLQWFALFFMLFMVPLPYLVVNAVTLPMKMAVSVVAEHVLFWAGYPVGRTGVILQVGQYMLQVADACAGLHTLLTLEALGLLYLNLVRRDSAVRNLGLAILIVPISFTANVIRVVALCLITYHFGDEAGQGFLHGFAGMVLFLSALLLIICFDSVLQGIEKLRPMRRRVLAP